MNTLKVEANQRSNKAAEFATAWYLEDNPVNRHEILEACPELNGIINPSVLGCYPQLHSMCFSLLRLRVSPYLVADFYYSVRDKSEEVCRIEHDHMLQHAAKLATPAPSEAPEVHGDETCWEWLYRCCASIWDRIARVLSQARAWVNRDNKRRQKTTYSFIFTCVVILFCYRNVWGLVYLLALLVNSTFVSNARSVFFFIHLCVAVQYYFTLTVNYPDRGLRTMWSNATLTAETQAWLGIQGLSLIHI